MQNGDAKQDLKSTNPHWYIVGAGAQGCLWAAYLLQAGFNVSLIVRRKEQQQKLIKQGLLLRTIKQTDKQLMPNNILCSQELHKTRPSIQHCLIATKTYHSLEAAKNIQPYLQTNAALLLLQNGMASQQEVCKLLPQHRLYALVSSEGALLKQGHHVIHTGLGDNQLGLLRLPPPETTKTPDYIYQQLQCSSLTLHWQTEIKQALINKLAINCAINALTACLDCRNGALTQAPHLERFKALCHETQKIISKLCEQYELNAIDVYTQALNVAQKTADNSSSMREDVRQQRPSEIHAINGYLIKQAQQMGLDCSLNQALMQQVLNLTPHD